MSEAARAADDASGTPDDESGATPPAAKRQLVRHVLTACASAALACSVTFWLLRERAPPPAPVPQAANLPPTTEAIITLSSEDGLCRRVIFDNATGRMRNSEPVACGKTAPRSREEQLRDRYSGRIDSIHDSWRGR